MTKFSRRDMNWFLAAGALSIASLATGAEAVTPRGFRRHPTKGLIAMTKELRDFTVEQFEALVGETFIIDGHETRLQSVRRATDTPEEFREPFALIFATPAGSTIQSHVVQVAHPAIGQHDLLVTQVMGSIDRTALEICFA